MVAQPSPAVAYRSRRKFGGSFGEDLETGRSSVNALETLVRHRYDSGTFCGPDGIERHNSVNEEGATFRVLDSSTCHLFGDVGWNIVPGPHISPCPGAGMVRRETACGRHCSPQHHREGSLRRWVVRFLTRRRGRLALHSQCDPLESTVSMTPTKPSHETLIPSQFTA